MQIAGRHYIMLPKLNSTQMRTLATRLAKEGFSVRGPDPLWARSEEGTINVEPSGVCWSSFDQSDVVLPVVPDLLAIPKERTPVKRMECMYVKVMSHGRSTLARLLLRVESGGNWDRLRSSGECGLAPDEHLVASSLISGADEVRLTTDFHVDGPAFVAFGRRRYFESKLNREQALKTLRVIGESGLRNSYLPRNGSLRFSAALDSSRVIVDILEELGDWCPFMPA